MNIQPKFPLRGTGGFDYIIAGAGCAGLSLVMHLLQSGKFSNKRILLIDKHTKNENDRTWCFWEAEPGLFEPIVYKKWEQLLFRSTTFSKVLSIQPYEYKLIRGIDFYEYCLQTIKNHPNVTIKTAAIESIFSNEAETGVVAGGEKLYAQYVFNSVLWEKPVLQKTQYWLLQHFKGWFIKTESAQFDPAIATLMDFKTDQSNGTTFFYVLPFSKKEALVEYTLFSKDLLKEELYEAALKNYIELELNINNYRVEHKEFGIIPMTNYSFPTQSHQVLHIGSAGGQTKASSGYTFRFIQKQSAAITDSLIRTGTPFSIKPFPARFYFYDSVLLNILHHRTLPGAEIFTDLFQKNRPQRVFRFLDNETALPEELRIISSLPTLPFLKAAIRQLQ